MRLDIKISLTLEKSREHAQALIASGFVAVNNIVQRKQSFKVLETDTVEVLQDLPKQPSKLIPSNIPLEIIFEDDFFLIINKQAGVSTHPPSINGENTIANAVVSILSENGIRPGIVHRLDKDTTGLLIIAKTEDAKYKMSEMIANREVERKYIGLCYGQFPQKTFKIEANIGRDIKNRLKMKILKTSGKTALTNIKLIQSFKEISIVEFKLETGRTHQIRLHMEHNKTPIVGDRTYGLKPPSFFMKFANNAQLKIALENTKRQMLHAFSLRFQHPFTNESIALEINPPADFANLIELLKE